MAPAPMLLGLELGARGQVFTELGLIPPWRLYIWVPVRFETPAGAAAKALEDKPGRTGQTSWSITRARVHTHHTHTTHAPTAPHAVVSSDSSVLYCGITHLPSPLPQFLPHPDARACDELDRGLSVTEPLGGPHTKTVCLSKYLSGSLWLLLRSAYTLG